MRAIKSYGVAAVLIFFISIWFSTGIIVEGGNGAHDSEKTVLSVIEADGGPLTDLMTENDLLVEIHQEDGVDDPALSIAERNALAAENAAASRIVRIKTFNIQPMDLKVTLRGYTQARATLAAVTQTSDIVKSVAVHEGQRIAAGDLICSLDNGTRQASVDQAAAALKQAEAALIKAQADYNTNAALREKGLVSENSAEGFAANLRAAESGVEAAQVALRNREKEFGNTHIYAALAGVVQGPIVEVGTLLNVGGACAHIIQLDPMVFIGAVPQSKITFVKLGLKAEITTITKQIAQGEVSFVAVSSDPATRTFELEIEFANPDGAIFDGLTAQATVQMGNIPAHLLPQSVLTLDSDGVLGAKVAENGKVVFYPLEILGDTRDGIWVSGLPLRVDIIVVGQEYVSHGQDIDARFYE